jgi:hypothetical protein
LLAADSGNQLVTEVNSGIAQPLDHACQVRDLDREPIPASWLGKVPSGIA